MLEEWRETMDDRAARLRIVGRLSPLWDCSLAETGEGESFHFKGVDLPVILQVKVSTPTMHYIDSDGGVFRTEDQWLKNKQLVRQSNRLIYALVVVTQDDYWAMATVTFEHDGKRKVFPKGREGAWNDRSNVMCVMLRKKHFRKVSPEPPWLDVAQRDLF